VAIEAKDRDVRNGDRAAEIEEENNELYAYIEEIEEQWQALEDAHNEALVTI